jgi:hypothetical protein
MAKRKEKKYDDPKKVENPDDDMDSGDGTVASRLATLNALLVPDRAHCTDCRS